MTLRFLGRLSRPPRCTALHQRCCLSQATHWMRIPNSLGSGITWNHYIYLIVICIIMYNLVNLAVIDNDIIKLLCYTYISIIIRLIIKQQGSRRWRDGSSLAHPKTTAFSKKQWMYSSMNFGGWPGWPIYLRPEMPVSTPSLLRSESFRRCW